MGVCSEKKAFNGLSSCNYVTKYWNAFRWTQFMRSWLHYFLCDDEVMLIIQFEKGISLDEFFLNCSCSDDFENFQTFGCGSVSIYTLCRSHVSRSKKFLAVVKSSSKLLGTIGWMTRFIVLKFRRHKETANFDVSSGSHRYFSLLKFSKTNIPLTKC